MRKLENISMKQAAKKIFLKKYFFFFKLILFKARRNIFACEMRILRGKITDFGENSNS